VTTGVPVTGSVVGLIVGASVTGEVVVLQLVHW
jgi:hypothetical protein